MSIATTPFEEPFKKAVQDQGVTGLALVVVAHPIAGHDQAGIDKKAEAAFADIVKAATEWQPGK
ncbi:MAG TPA: hypothetical protein PLJ35_03820 [Anaerolineae bacterium]|nr:hypothetical protein [Anaerolineae bacterium]HOQ97931.1 hypothetical protein [Anaerolineae bacterium]